MVAGRMRGEAAVFEVEPFDLFMFSLQEMVQMMHRFAEFYAAHRGNVRIIALSRKFDMTTAVARLLEETAQATEEWQRQGKDAYRRFITQLVAHVQLKTTKFYLVAWPKSPAERQAVLGLAQSVFCVADNRLYDAQLPPLFEGEYGAQWGHLAPTNGRGPLVAILISRDITGDMDFSTTTRILGLPFPIALSVDVQTVPHQQAQTRLTMAYNKLTAQLSTVDTKDVESETGLQGVEFAMEQVKAGEGLHQVQLAVAVFGADEEELKARIEEVKMAASPAIQLRVALGEQERALAFFSSIEKPKVSGLRPRNMLSTGCAVLTPFGFRQRDDVSGILLGIEQAGGYPVFDDFWARASYNLVILGETGYGKTFGAMVWLHREALRGTQIILLDPQGNCKTLADITGGSYVPLSFAQGLQLNLLDVTFDSLPTQVSHVISGLEGLLKEPLTNLEKGAVDSTLRPLYAGLPARCTLAQMPRLEDLARGLREHEYGRGLAARLERFISGSYGQVFNRPTNVDIRLDQPVVALDVEHVEEEYRALIMMLLMGSISHRILSDPGRRRIIYIDEFGILTALGTAAGEAVARGSAELFKRVRRFKAGIWAVDQNLITFVGNPYGRQILENAEQVTMYHQAVSALPAVREHFGQLTEQHIQRLSGAAKGENVTTIGNRLVYQLFTQASPAELQVFARS